MGFGQVRIPVNCVFELRRGFASMALGHMEKGDFHARLRVTRAKFPRFGEQWRGFVKLASRSQHHTQVEVCLEICRIALQFPGATTKLHTSSLFYLALILLVIGLVTNLLAQLISRRFDYQVSAAR